jgi:hypothetical protein
LALGQDGAPEEGFADAGDETHAGSIQRPPSNNKPASAPMNNALLTNQTTINLEK